MRSKIICKFNVRYKIFSIKDFLRNRKSYRLLRNAGYLNIRIHISVCIIHSLETKLYQSQVQRLMKIKRQKKNSAFIIYLCRFAVRFWRDSLNFQSLVTTRNEALPLLELRPSTFVSDVRYAAFATPRIMASPIIDSVAECRSGVYDRCELPFLLSRFNVRFARVVSLTVSKHHRY